MDNQPQQKKYKERTMIELNISSKTKKRKAFISIALVLALAITGALAFLTARDSAENKFTVGNVDIELTEPNWDENNAKNIVSGQIIAKDPTITNTGRNDAYVYMMVEIPKAIETDIVSTDESGNEVTTTKSNYPLFSFVANEGWTPIDSQTGTNIDAYDYYLYGYNTALTPGNAATLFNEVAFANVTSDFVDTYAGENNDLSLDINVTGYAIQSDYYNNEATDAATAWMLYVNQNDWTWPDKKYAGLSTLSFVSEDGDVVNTETAYAGTPVEMYFEPSLAKDGYTFDWVDETTNEVAYSGMPMPEEDTTLTATYTETGYGEDASDFLIYNIYEEDNGFYASVRGLDTSNPNCPTVPSTIIIPSQIEVTKVAIPDGSVKLQSPNGKINAYFRQGSALALLDDVQDTFVATVNSIGALEDPDGLIETLVVADTVTNIDGVKCGVDKLIKNMKKMILPYGVETIAGSTFMSYTPLTEITLPASLTAIGNKAFQNCTNLTTINSDLHSVISLGTNAFAGCDNLDAEIIINGNIGTIPVNVFSNTKITSVEIETGITQIEQSAFAGCPSLTRVSIPNSVTSIGNSAFAGCSSLTSITIPEGVTSIGATAFEGCTSLANVTLPDSLTDISSNVFENTALYNNAENWEGKVLYVGNCLMKAKPTIIGAYEIKFGTRLIAGGAFTNCSSLTAVTIPDSVTTINASAFSGCTGLTSVTIGNGVTTIKGSTFFNCSSLTSITIPDSVTTIDGGAFNLCRRLTTASVPSTCTVASNAFPSTCTVIYR